MFSFIPLGLINNHQESTIYLSEQGNRISCNHSSMSLSGRKHTHTHTNWFERPCVGSAFLERETKSQEGHGDLKYFFAFG